MSTQQPEWELIANLGDVNVADYGGFLVYRDKTGVYQAEAEVYEPNDDGAENGGTMYRFILEPPRFKTLTAEGKRTMDYKRLMAIPSQRGVTWCWHNEWFIDKLPDVAKSCGHDSHRGLLKDLLSKDPIRMASAYVDIVGYFGAHEFDHYATRLTEADAQERYKSI